MKRYQSVLMVLATLVLLAGAALPTWAQESNEDDLVNLVAASEEFTDWLTGYPGWQGAAYYDGDGDTWYVEFYDASGDEWLGYANVVDGSEEILDAFAPRPLPPDEFQAGQERIHTLVLEDPEVQALLVDPILWDIYVDFNRWDQVWEVWMARGVDAWVVSIALTDEYFSIDDIVAGHTLEEEETVKADRDEAISLAYSAPGIDGRLDGFDNWRTYAEQHGDSIWSVAFVSGDTELFYALVNVDSDTVLETSAQ